MPRADYRSAYPQPIEEMGTLDHIFEAYRDRIKAQRNDPLAQATQHSTPLETRETTKAGGAPDSCLQPLFRFKRAIIRASVIYLIAAAMTRFWETLR